MAHLIDVALVDSEKGGQALRSWTYYCGGLIEADRDNYQKLSVALARAAEEADRLYPKLESGEKVGMNSLEVCGPEWDLGEESAEVFIGLIVTILFSSIDGPRSSVVHLQDALVSLVKIADERREEASE